MHLDQQPADQQLADQQLADRLLSDRVLSAGRSGHSFENTVERLGAAIRLGLFPVGSALPPERDLATSMGVSRATLREAIAALRMAGMVETTRGRGGGSTVQPLPDPTPTEAAIDGLRDELADSLVFRRVVEPGAAQLAAEAEPDAADRELLATRLAAVAAADGPAEHRQADSLLHLTIATMSGSAQLLEAVRRVQADLHRMLTAIPVLQANLAHSDHQHAAIVAAIVAGRPAAARRAMQEHCDDTAALLRGLLG